MLYDVNGSRIKGDLHVQSFSITVGCINIENQVPTPIFIRIHLAPIGAYRVHQIFPFPKYNHVPTPQSIRRNNRTGVQDSEQLLEREVSPVRKAGSRTSCIVVPAHGLRFAA